MSPEPGEGSASIRIVRVRGQARELEVEDRVAREEPLEIRVRGRSIAITMRTPGHDPELAAGFLLSEGILKQRRDVTEIAPCPTTEAGPSNVLNVFLAPDVEVDLEKLSRHVFASSSCGLCGKASIEDVLQNFPPLNHGLTITNSVLAGLPAALGREQALFDRTGSVHAAALFDLEGNLVLLREDVGRHNAVDKVIGCAWLNGPFPLEKHLLLVSGRTSFEITQKALAARIAFVASISGPSSLAVSFARESGQTLIGFLRPGTFNIYAHPNGVIDPRISGK